MLLLLDKFTENYMGLSSHSVYYNMPHIVNVYRVHPLSVGFWLWGSRGGCSTVLPPLLAPGCARCAIIPVLMAAGKYLFY